MRVCRRCDGELQGHPNKRFCEACRVIAANEGKVRREHERRELWTNEQWEAWHQYRRAADARRRRTASPERKSRDRARRATRRAQKRTTAVELIRYEDIYDRDRGICQLCFTDVPLSLNWPHEGAGTLDHIYPLVLGGCHVWDNLQLVHSRCNIAKGAKLTCLVVVPPPSLLIK